MIHRQDYLVCGSEQYCPEKPEKMKILSAPGWRYCILVEAVWKLNRTFGRICGHIEHKKMPEKKLYLFFSNSV
jgi:hypothetical protein